MSGKSASAIIIEMKRKFEEASQGDTKKKRKSRWGASDETGKTYIPGMPTTLPANLSAEQEEQYLIHLQIEEKSRRLRSGDLGISPNPEERSPSPEPIYNNEGKRLNTREYRTRKKLEEDRHALILQAQKLNAEYKPPADYRPPLIRITDKVWIPQDRHPEINFVGLLIGPRGNTLKMLEKETGAKIIIRGKGSVKDGKIGRKDGQPLPGEDEPLHAYITANNPDFVKCAVDKINEIIKQGIEVPEAENDLRKQQLRELALLNGTLRENDGLAKLKQLAQAQTIITNTIICTVCGGAGHIAQDCKQKRPGESILQLQASQTAADRAKMDSEYMSLMAELGQGPPVSSTPSLARPALSSSNPRLLLRQPAPFLSQPPPAVINRPIRTVPPPQLVLGGGANPFATLPVRPVPAPTIVSAQSALARPQLQEAMSVPPPSFTSPPPSSLGKILPTTLSPNVPPPRSVPVNNVSTAWLTNSQPSSLNGLQTNHSTSNQLQNSTMPNSVAVANTILQNALRPKVLQQNVALPNNLLQNQSNPLPINSILANNIPSAPAPLQMNAFPANQASVTNRLPNPLQSNLLQANPLQTNPLRNPVLPPNFMQPPLQNPLQNSQLQQTAAALSLWAQISQMTAGFGQPPPAPTNPHQQQPPLVNLTLQQLMGLSPPSPPG